jgi:hypothetical protein
MTKRSFVITKTGVTSSREIPDRLYAIRSIISPTTFLKGQIEMVSKFLSVSFCSVLFCYKPRLWEHY